jgi:hypothetical protein
MTQLRFDTASGFGGPLACGLMASGRIDIRPGSPDEGPAMSAAAQQRICDAFGGGRGKGVLYLGAAEPGTDLSPALSYWRDIGKTFVARVCGALEPTAPKSLVITDPDPDDIAAFVKNAPPMPGAELITPELLGELWSDVGKALASAAAGHPEGVPGYT